MQRLKLRIFLIIACFLAAHLCTRLLPGVLETWDARLIDRLAGLRADSTRPLSAYEEAIAHIRFNSYLNRSYHAQVIRNLAAMPVAAQLFDYVFDAPSLPQQDQALIDATREAGNVYYGLKFERLGNPEPLSVEGAAPPPGSKLERIPWSLAPQSDPAALYVGLKPLATFAELARSARGIGYINLKSDRDGVFRRIPLMVRAGDGVYPSLSFRAACDYLGVPPEKIILTPGRSITLQAARRPGAAATQDIVIPIDRKGNMRINFTGFWNRIPHINYSDMFNAYEDPARGEAWKAQLAGKIVIISEDTTGSSDVGQITSGNLFPLSGLHADVLYTILTESFITELSTRQMILIELVLLMMIMILSLRFSALPFSYGTISLAAAYVALAVGLYWYANIILSVARPLLMAALAMMTIQIAIAVEKARQYAEAQKAREIAERELEIGREIQAGFFPEYLPQLAGWEIAAHFQAARQVAGDFYDAFTLDGDRKLGLVIADVCDKGVGAALFMAIFRSLIRAFAAHSCSQPGASEQTVGLEPEAVLLNTVRLTNNYIARTHDRENMFATLFFGILDPSSGRLDYINAGHEPPLIIGSGRIKSILPPTGPVVGAYPEVTYQTGRVRLDFEEALVAYTDGIIDAKNQAGQFFSKEKLMGLFDQSFPDADTLLRHIRTHIDTHIGDTLQYDDITVMIIRRQARDLTP